MKLHCLHLSDLHLTGKDPAGVFSQDAVTGSMLRLISELENRPDFVIITGDLAYSGKPEEYEIVHNFCEHLLKAAKLEHERLFIVPGNHDADRSEVRPKHIKSFYPFESQDDITETFTDPDIFPILMRKFSGFSPFAEKAAGRNLFDDSKLWLAETLCLGEDRINLIGLNSCLFAGYDGDDRQKLALGLYQVEKALKGMDEKAFLSIGFFHHPFSCFHSADKVCENLLTKRLDLQDVIKAEPRGYELVRIPGGTFMMGSPESEKGRDNDEGPLHKVHVPVFYMGRYPVTNEEYEQFLEARPNISEPRYWGESRLNKPRQPVVGVSWHEAKQYAEWAELRLPSEAEWEYACRAGTDSMYYFGDDESLLSEYAWYNNNSNGRTHTVGQKKPNAQGLYDMHGNAWECMGMG
ncbi:MAG: SUMF1/EgtB/PvdO family nonheme iron enzyme [Desulfobacteraceae bacterium]|nr:SUMF1/EgtB/PvdO family nonheme iron enzyme [Desulfobacteraceae bacterium]